MSVVDIDGVMLEYGSEFVDETHPRSLDSQDFQYFGHVVGEGLPTIDCRMGQNSLEVGPLCLQNPILGLRHHLSFLLNGDLLLQFQDLLDGVYPADPIPSDFDFEVVDVSEVVESLVFGLELLHLVSKVSVLVAP